jgi:uncharacterized protein YfaQ (DUF2300 family)
VIVALLAMEIEVPEMRYRPKHRKLLPDLTHSIRLVPGNVAAIWTKKKLGLARRNNSNVALVKSAVRVGRLAE